MNERIDYLDFAKAICIVLVVVGHFNPVPVTDGWSAVVKIIYSFHMPLFMFVSGLLFAKTFKPQPYQSFVTKKFRHLMIPYFLTSLFIIGIKLLMQNILPVKNPVGLNDFITMFYRPSAAVHLWFIWALMLIYLIVPLCRSRYARLAFLAATAALWLIPFSLPNIFALPQFKANAVFFAAGMVAEEFKLQPYFKKPYSAIIILLFAATEFMLVKGIALPVLKIVLPFVGILFILTLSRILSDSVSGRPRQAFLYVGRSSMIIFLLHSAFGEFGKAALSLAGITSQSHFYLTLLVFVTLGVCAPLLLKAIWRKVSVR